MRAASTRSSRSPASAPAMTTFSLRRCCIDMNDPLTDDEKPLDPAAAGIVAKVRWLMIISGVTTLVAIAAVVGVIGYRVFRAEGSAAQSAARADVTALLPKGARVVAVTAAEDRIVVTIELAGALEARTFDLKTLAPTGRLRFATEP
jgi:hypothetical protein